MSLLDFSEQLLNRVLENIQETAAGSDIKNIVGFENLAKDGENLEPVTLLPTLQRPQRAAANI